MEAATCFFSSSKSFAKTLELLPSLKLKVPLPPHSKRRAAHRRFYRTCGGAQSPAATRCSLRPSKPEDDSELSIKSDWRSFRARLIAGEEETRLEEPHSALSCLSSDRAGRTSTPVVLRNKWAHPLHEPEKGCLLIASEKLDGVHIFERAVVLIISMGPIGPLGLILNRPSLMSIKDSKSTDLDIAGIFSDRPLYFGGPIEEGSFLVSSPLGRDNEVGRSGVFEEVMDGVYYGTKESVGCAAEMVKRNVVGVGDFRFFDGCCGWDKEQLKEEIRAGYWNVAACSPSVIELTGVGSVGLWEEVLGLVGGRKVW